MKIKNLFLLFLSLITVSEISAQKKGHGPLNNKSSVKINVKWGAEYKKTRDETIKDIIYDDGENIYANVVTTKTSIIFAAYTTPKITPSLVKYDGKMSPVKRIDYGNEEKNTYYHGTFYIKGSFVILTSTFDSKTNTRILHAEKFNSDLEKEGDKITLWKIVGDKGQDMNFTYRLSQDSSKFFVLVTPELKKTENCTFKFKIFDQDFKELYDKTVKLNVPSNQAILKNVIINNNSDVFALLKMYNDDKIKEEVKSASGDKVPGYKYDLIKYSTDGSENKFDVELKDKFMNNYDMITDKAGNLKVILSYTTAKGDGIHGFMNLIINASGNNFTKYDYPVTDALAERIDKMQDDRPSKKVASIHSDFSFSDFNIMEDGSSYAILEKDYSVSDKYGKTFFSMGMIVLKMDEKGEFSWCTFIPKSQFFNSFDGFIYHTVMFINNKLFLFYNDEAKNENYNIVDAPKPPARYNGIKDVDLMMVEFDDSGKPSRSLVGNTEKFGTNILMTVSKQLSPDRMVLCGTTMNHFGGNMQIKLGVAEFE